MDDVKPTEEFGKLRFPKWMTSNPLKREEPGNEVWEMAFPEMDDVRERSLGTRFGKRRFPKVTLCNTIIVLQTSLMICKSAKLEIVIFFTINFDAEVLNEFGVFILLESKNHNARSPNQKESTAK